MAQLEVLGYINQNFETLVQWTIGSGKLLIRRKASKCGLYDR
jgi:hypothetical protein